MTHTDLLEPMGIEASLKALGELRDGWLDGYGYAPDRAALHQLASAVEERFDRDLPPPWLYPTPDGGVQAEWTLGDWAISLDISLPAFKADYQALNLRTDEQHDVELALDTEAGWQKLNAALKALHQSVIGAHQSR